MKIKNKLLVVFFFFGLVLLISFIYITPYSVKVETSDSVITEEWLTVTANGDVTPPTWRNLTEDSDPTELGVVVIFKINVTDESGINQVLLEIFVNYSMSNSGDIYTIEWLPSEIGVFLYFIHMEDNNNNWNITSGTIEVFVADTTDPTCWDLEESTDPVILGDNVTISIKAYDLNGISLVFIRIDGGNYMMYYELTLDIWIFEWTPTKVGSYNYTIYISDNRDNWEDVSGSIKVISEELPEVLPEDYTIIIIGITVIIGVICLLIIILKFNLFGIKKKIGKKYSHYAYANTKGAALLEVRRLKSKGYSTKVEILSNKNGKSKYRVLRRKKMFNIKKRR